MCITYLEDCGIPCEHGDCYGDECNCDQGWGGEHCDEGNTLTINTTIATL